MIPADVLKQFSLPLRSSKVQLSIEEVLALHRGEMGDAVAALLVGIGFESSVVPEGGYAVGYGI